MGTTPTHEQGQLHLQVYDLRREARLRQAREWFFRNYIVETIEDSRRIAPPATENGALLNYGLLNEDLFFETSGEFFAVWERIKPIIKEGREKWANSLFLANLEKAAERFEAWSNNRTPGAIAAMRQIMKQMQPQRTATARA